MRRAGAVGLLWRFGAFTTLENAVGISRQISFPVLVMLGATLMMAVGEFDLSVGAVASVGGVLAALLAVRGLPAPLCCAPAEGWACSTA